MLRNLTQATTAFSNGTLKAVGCRCNETDLFFRHLCYTKQIMKKAFLSVFMLAALAGSAQKVSNKLSFQKGQTLEVTTNMNITSQTPMGEIPMNMVMTDQYAVGEASTDKTQLTKTPKRIKLGVNAMGQDMNADSDNPKDLEGRLGEPIKEMMKQKQEFTVDASGVVTSVKADEKKKKAEGGDMMSMMMPGMNSGAVMAVAGQPSIFKVLPGHEIAKGDTWTDTLNAEGNKSKTVYTVKDITEKEILLDYTGEGTSKTTQSAMGMSADVSASTKNSGTIVLDRATGLLKQKTMTANTDSSMSMGGQDINSTTKMTVVMTVKTL